MVFDDNGARWMQVGSVSDASALLLAADASTRVYFQGDTNFNGTRQRRHHLPRLGPDQRYGGHQRARHEWRQFRIFERDRYGEHHGHRIDDNPVVINDRIIVSNSTLVTIPVSALLGNDSDIDGIALTITSVGSATGITGLTLNANGTITFTSGSDSGGDRWQLPVHGIRWRGGTATGTVTIDIRTVGTGNGVDTIDLSGAGTYQASYIDGRGGADNLTGGAAGDVLSVVPGTALTR